MNWVIRRFGDLCDITRGASPRPIHDFMAETGMPWVKIADATSSDSKYLSKTEGFIKAEGISKSVHVFPGDLIVSNSATPGIPKFMAIEACIHDGWLLLRNFRGLSKNFCYWLLITQRSNLLLQGNGSVFTNLKTDILKNHEVRIPESKQDQDKVASILDSIAAKIESNRKLNETLEGMARALFQSWFVDFDPVKAKLAALRHGRDAEKACMAALSGKLRICPGKPKPETLDDQLPTAEELDAAIAELDSLAAAQLESLSQSASHFPSDFQDSELGLIPQGWRYLAAQEIAQIGIGRTPPRKESQWFSVDKADIPWVSIKDMGNSGIFMQETSESLTKEAVSRFNIRLIPKGTVLLSFKLTVGRVVISDMTLTTNEAIAHFGLNATCMISSEFMYLYLSRFDYTSLGSTSSIATAVNSATIRAMPILVPAKELAIDFTKIISPIFNEIKSNQFESRTLAELRDALLPKLLSGEIAVGEAVDTVPEAARS